MRSTVIIIAAIAWASVASAGLTLEQKCQDAIAGSARKYWEARYKALEKCHDARAKTGTPADCSIDTAVQEALTKAETKLSDKLTAKCPGTFAAQADLGLACKNAASVADVVDCVTDDVHGPSADLLIDTAYHDSGQITDLLLLKCQKTLGKALLKGSSARQKARGKCAKPIALVENPPTICPDEKALLALDKARTKLITIVETACSADRCTNGANDGQACATNTDCPGGSCYVQVLDTALKFGGDCGDDRAGAPASAFQYMTFERAPAPTNNSIPPKTRLSRCLAAATAVAGDTGAAAVDAFSDLSAFSYGVAAGDPTDTSFIAWTRINAASADLRVSTTPTFGTPLVINAIPAGGDDTIKVEVTGLSPSTQYYYQFTSGSDVSRIGRIRTAPSPSSTAPATFAFTGDSNAFFKPYSVLEGITRDDPDLFLYIGDTIYSDDPRSGTGVATTVADYRAKYAENRDDSALRNLMASVGTATIWDDHEVTNDFYGSPFGAFGPQIIAGNQAYREWMPIREDGGDPMKLYRSIKWGDVAEFFLTDNRQYRAPQAYVTEPACLSGSDPATLPPAGACQNEINDPARTYLGAAQKAWLKGALAASTAKWKFIMNGPVVTGLLFLPYDRWEGYAAERTEMLEFIRNPDGNTMTNDHLKNVVVLSTDIHAAIYNPTVTNPGPAGGSVPEIIAGAIGMDPIYRELPAAILPLLGSLPSFFPTIQWYDIDRRNYVHFDVSTTQATFTYRDNTGSVLRTITMNAE